MNPIWCVLEKEVLDNLRDRRSFFFALVYGQKQPTYLSK